MQLSDKISDNFRLLETHKKALKKLGLETLHDLLYHFPVRYGESYDVLSIENLEPKKRVTIYGTLKNLKTNKTFQGRVPMAQATITDDTGSIKCIWFSQPYIAKMFENGDLVRAEGIVGEKKSGDLSLNNPKIEKVSNVSPEKNSLFADEAEKFLYPTYPESKGISSNWIYQNITKILSNPVLDKIKDPIPSEILEKYNLPNLRTALIWIHSPKKDSDALSARKRFAFEEIFYIQVQKQIQRQSAEKLKSFVIKQSKSEIEKFTNRFGFELTDSQKKSIDAILKDFEKGQPMSRLLEGDVGSGKTAVAATAVYAVTKTAPPDHKHGILQTAYMVPTEILAKQHFENFIQYFKHTGVQVALMTGSGCYKFPSKVDPETYTKISRTQLIKWIENGEIPILVGTHALIQKTVNFKNLGFVIIDEQHRFGTKQRQKLAQKSGFAPHLLSMTATPIPRTLALTIYGDLDLTLVDQMPLGRKPVITDIVLENERNKTYEKIRNEINSGRQVYVICPRINEPDENKKTVLLAKSVKSEVAHLRKEIFPEFEIAELHGKMKPAEKESVMKDFEDGKINILVATSVIEVGVNVPNATTIIIEGAERFGLSQLHQLRGRVIRSNHQAYCYIFTNSKTETSLKRLQALKSSKNGFELSEYDLKLRGSGELAGNKQWGITDLGMEAIKNIKMVEAARNEAKELVEKDSELSKYPELAEKISNKTEIHFE
jgi:ATP-dependent DNA helicase RecG